MTTTGEAFSCTRWRRYGHDRLYVATAGGEKLGYRDLASGVDVPVSESDRALLARLADGWAGGSAPAPAPAPEQPVAESWRDLSLNRPGASLHQLASSARAEAPVRTALARVFGLHTQERAWRIGARGEELVGAVLERACRRDPRWRVLHTVPVGEKDADIDHLLIGPGGVVTVNTKHHPRRRVWVGGEVVMVGGRRQPYVRNSRHEAGRAARILERAVGHPVPTQALIVTVGADLTIRTAPAAGVTVLQRRGVQRWLRRRPEVLEEPTVAALWDAARRSTTWQPEPR